MVDYLSRIKQLTIKLGLQNNSKSEPLLTEELRKSCSKLLLEDDTRASPEIGKVKLRKQLTEKPAVNIDDDDEVFYDGVDGKKVDDKFQYQKVTPNPTLKSPLVNKRLAKVKRPLVVTRSVPLSPAAIPDKDKMMEDKLRADTDFLCGEMVNMLAYYSYNIFLINTI